MMIVLKTSTTYMNVLVLPAIVLSIPVFYALVCLSSFAIQLVKKSDFTTISQDIQGALYSTQDYTSNGSIVSLSDTQFRIRYIPIIVDHSHQAIKGTLVKSRIPSIPCNIHDNLIGELISSDLSGCRVNLRNISTRKSQLNFPYFHSLKFQYAIWHD